MPGSVAAIETLYDPDRNETLWIVKLDRKILGLGVVANDPSGSTACAIAKTWASEHNVVDELEWSHALAS